MPVTTTIESTDSAGVVANSRPPCSQFPFAAVVGHQTAKRAMLLLAIEPRLRGALIASTGGSHNRVLAGAFGALPQRLRQIARGHCLIPPAALNQPGVVELR
jgi:hypothetical protein